MAHILTAKFADALPFCRQERQFAQLGTDICRATMCRWAMKVAEACEPIKRLLQQEVLSGPLITDETTVQVLKEPGKLPFADAISCLPHQQITSSSAYGCNGKRSPCKIWQVTGVFGGNVSCVRDHSPKLNTQFIGN